VGSPSRVRSRRDRTRSGHPRGSLNPGWSTLPAIVRCATATTAVAQGAAIGRGLFPKPPDMRAAATQSLTDGEIFYIIENGVRFTGMPAFGTGKPDPAGEKQVWQLVRFIRHVPRITPDEIDWMKSLNPF
jgi:hypothetical protein